MNFQSPLPRFATPRNPGFGTFGPAVDKVSTAMGRPLQPWQRQVLDVALEVDETGKFVHPLVIVSVPRQSGKTVSVLATAVHRALLKPDAKVWLTAQTGMDARERWTENAQVFERSPLKSLARMKWGAGDQRMIFRNGSQFRPHPPTQDALHGTQSDLNIIDEAWSFTDSQGQNLLQAIVPTQATRPGAQLMLTSTMGTADSTWFHRLSDRGRDGDPGVCYFEWSIPDDVDPMDLSAVCAAHPAVGNTIGREAVEAAAAQLSPGEFARAYGNRRTGAAERLVPVHLWNKAQTEIPIPVSARVAFGAAVSIDRDEVCICAAALVDGVPCVELVDSRPGTAWAAPRIVQLASRHTNLGVAVDRFGPSVTLHDELHIAKIETLPIGVQDVTSAAADLLDRLHDGRVTFMTNAAFDSAMNVLAKRSVGDRFAFARQVPTGNIAAIEAASLAVHALMRDRGPAQAPVLRFAS